MSASPERAAEYVAHARANLTQATADLCSHGVQPKLCKDRSHETESEGA